jgi:hypothetical protein
VILHGTFDINTATESLNSKVPISEAKIVSDSLPAARPLVADIPKMTGEEYDLLTAGKSNALLVCAKLISMDFELPTPRGMVQVNPLRPLFSQDTLVHGCPPTDIEGNMIQ